MNDVVLITYVYEYPRQPDHLERGSALETLPFFLEHYARLGVSEILMVLNVHGHPDLEERMSRLCRPVKVVSEPLATRSPLEHIQSVLNERQPGWYIKADLDEFQEYPLPLDEMVRQLSKRQRNVVTGRLVDYVAADGNIARIQPQVPLEDQFPVACHLTREVVQGSARKVMLCRGAVRLTSSGAHRARGEKRSRMQGVVRHYKWHGDVLDRLQVHARSGRRYCEESQRFLEWYQTHNLLGQKRSPKEQDLHG